MTRLAFVTIIAVTIWLSGCAEEGKSVFVDGVIPLDKDCIADPSGDSLRVAGSYDITPGSCAQAYRGWFRINSLLRKNSDTDLGRSEPNILQVTNAEVRLMTVARETLDFGGGEFPNPFMVISNASIGTSQGNEPGQGVALIDVIPAGYGEFLSRFDGQQILAEVTIFGKTLGDVSVDFQPYIYPMDICMGCNVICGSDNGGADYAEYCEDACCGLPYDNSLCFDSGC